MGSLPEKLGKGSSERVERNPEKRADVATEKRKERNDSKKLGRNSRGKPVTLRKQVLKAGTRDRVQMFTRAGKRRERGGFPNAYQL